MAPASRRASTRSALSLVAGLAVLLAACGTSLSPSPAATGASPATASGSPAASGGVRPETTPWPGNAVLGIEALGVADGEIRKGINDFNAWVENGDEDALQRAADGLSRVDTELLPNVERIEIFDQMRPLADGLRETLAAMGGAARDLRTAIDAGDGEAVTEASQDLIAAFTQYAELQSDLAAFVVQIPEQKRLLLN